MRFANGLPKRGKPLYSTAVILNGPRDLGLDRLSVTTPGADDLVVEVTHSGISTGTEKLLWTGDMPPFPGMGYPLVPGYEAAGEVVEAGPATGYKLGDRVFVPGANCFDGAFGLFGGAASLLVTQAERVTRIDPALKAEGALFWRWRPRRGMRWRVRTNPCRTLSWVMACWAACWRG